LTARALIIGYGNPLRGDDGLGWRAAERLRETILDQEVEIRTGHQLTPELAETASHVRLVVFIDANCDTMAGEVVSRKIEPDRSPSELFTHRLTPEVLLGMAEKLYGRSPEGFLISVGAASFEHGDQLSPAVESALPAVIEKVQTLCGAGNGAAGIHTFK
jgi:hydrogenase maturation protease